MNLINNDAHQSNQFEYIKRCNQYYKIPLIKLTKTKNNYYIECKCENVIKMK